MPCKMPWKMLATQICIGVLATCHHFGLKVLLEAGFAMKMESWGKASVCGHMFGWMKRPSHLQAQSFVEDGNTPPENIILFGI